MAFDYGSKEIETAGYKEKNSKVYSKTLFGQDILKNSVPIWTADKTKTPYVIFRIPIPERSLESAGISFPLDCLQWGRQAVGKRIFLI